MPAWGPTGFHPSLAERQHSKATAEADCVDEVSAQRLGARGKLGGKTVKCRAESVTRAEQSGSEWRGGSGGVPWRCCPGSGAHCRGYRALVTSQG